MPVHGSRPLKPGTLRNILRTAELSRTEFGKLRDIQEIAEAEAYEDDPLRSRMVEASDYKDAFGIAEVFSS